MVATQEVEGPIAPVNGELSVVPANPLTILSRMVERGADPTSIERMSALAERWQEIASREKFATALAAFQAECPAIHKGRKADRFQYAGFDDVMKVAGPILARHTISVAFDSQHTDKLLVITCRIRVGPYHEDRSFSVPVPASLKVSEPQQYGAALSYAKRYCLCAALNIVTTDEDNENNLLVRITPDQIAVINTQLQETGMGVDAFNKAFEIESLDMLPAVHFAAAMVRLNDYKTRKARASK